MAEENEELEIEEEEQEQVNALELSDEEIMNMTEPPGSAESNDVVLSDDNDPEHSAAEEGGNDVYDDDASEASTETGDDADTLEGEDDGLQSKGQEAAAEEEVATAQAGKEGEPDDQGDEAKTDTKDTVTAKDQLAKLFAPFKANGKQMQVATVDDALTLMQMGANYNKKMAGLKPSLRIVKMLENNDLLDEGKINHLIDLSKKNPAAIAHLMKDGGIDPLDIDTAEADEYKPETYTVNDQDVELDAVLDDIRETPQFKDTMDIIGNKWDLKSRQSLYDEPGAIRTINNHVGAGLFPQIMNIVDSERALGRLTNLSDIDAYQHVGNVIQANGGFNQTPAQEQPKTQTGANVQQISAPKATADPQLKKRKRAAAPTKGSPGHTPVEYNPLALSDEEFEKASAHLM